MSPVTMVAMQGVCIAFLLIVLSAYIFLPRSGSLKKDRFFFSLLLTLLGVFFDTVSWACEIAPANEVIQYASNFMSLIMTSFIVPVFGYYIHDLINEKQHLSENFARVITAVNLAGAAVTVAAAICGRLFDINFNAENPAVPIYDDGGFFYELPIVLSTLSLAFLFVLVLRYSKALGKQKIAVFAIYFLLPLLAGFAEVAADELQFSYIATCISMCIVYVMLQSSHINELLLRERLLNEISYIDQLTGLPNRRACDRDMDLIAKDDAVGVVFCDLNGLKKVNDEEGHHAGDRFLITFAEIITKHFSRDFVYRISGDEFVVIARGMGADEFAKNAARLKREIDRNSGIAAFGTATGTGEDIPALVKKAEMAMYADKKDFYLLNPDRRRGKSAYMSIGDGYAPSDD